MGLWGDKVKSWPPRGAPTPRRAGLGARKGEGVPPGAARGLSQGWSGAGRAGLSLEELEEAPGVLKS